MRLCPLGIGLGAAVMLAFVQPAAGAEPPTMQTPLVRATSPAVADPDRAEARQSWARLRADLIELGPMIKARIRPPMLPSGYVEEAESAYRLESLDAALGSLPATMIDAATIASVRRLEAQEKIVGRQAQSTKSIPTKALPYRLLAERLPGVRIAVENAVAMQTQAELTAWFQRGSAGAIAALRDADVPSGVRTRMAAIRAHPEAEAELPFVRLTREPAIIFAQLALTRLAPADLARIERWYTSAPGRAAADALVAAYARANEAAGAAMFRGMLRRARAAASETAD